MITLHIWMTDRILIMRWEGGKLSPRRNQRKKRMQAPVPGFIQETNQSQFSEKATIVINVLASAIWKAIKACSWVSAVAIGQILIQHFSEKVRSTFNVNIMQAMQPAEATVSGPTRTFYAPSGASVKSNSPSSPRLSYLDGLE